MYSKFLSFLLSLLLIFNLSFPALAEETKYPDYAKMYVGEDKLEGFNRKMFTLNSKLNKFVARPVHILWASIMPQYGMDRIQSAYNNIEYPKRLASCIVQKDGQGIKNETIRFLTNTTIGIGGLFDPASKLLKVKPTNENMDQALCKCKVKSGTYMVMPVLNACTPRSLCGRALEAALDPSVYLASPLTALVKFGLMVNRTSYMQPIAKMLESTYADPYDIQKKLFGIESYIKSSNLDRQDLLETDAKLVDEESALMEEINAMVEGESYLALDEPPEELGVFTGAAVNLEDLEIIKHEKLEPDIILSDFNPQSPIVDSMRTALFDDPEIDKSIWNELSIWNRSFGKRIKTSSVEVVPNRDEYKFRYIMQKDKNAPLVILFPSVGEGYNAHHNTVFAKMFYDEGYSIVMLGSHFHWEFAKSMPEGYCPGNPQVDVDNIKLVTRKILDKLENKYECEFNEKYVIGTSFGALSSLFLADRESKNNTLGITRFIAISPPVELVYAVEQLDKNSQEFDNNSPDVKHKTATTAAKILQITNLKNTVKDLEISELPFTEQEGKLITTFLLRQKLSDLVFTIENASKNKKCDIYQKIHNMSYKDYVENYILNGESIETMRYASSLYSLADYLTNNDNYKIYHSPDDFFATEKQIATLKTFAGKHLTCLSNGSHLGFLYRKEFQDALRADVSNKI